MRLRGSADQHLSATQTSLFSLGTALALRLEQRHQQLTAYVLTSPRHEDRPAIIADQHFAAVGGRDHSRKSGNATPSLRRLGWFNDFIVPLSSSLDTVPLPRPPSRRRPRRAREGAAVSRRSCSSDSYVRSPRHSRQSAASPLKNATSSSKPLRSPPIPAGWRPGQARAGAPRQTRSRLSGRDAPVRTGGRRPRVRPLLPP
jgi:hypothetical protein